MSLPHFAGNDGPMDTGSSNAATQDSSGEDSKRDLLRCGLDHLRTAGHASISVRALASCANLSPGAPYYHFGTRRGLLCALALEGFRQNNSAAAKIVRDGAADPRRVLADLAHRFIAFSLENPHLFELMYESELTHPVDPALSPAFRQAFDIVVGAVASARGESEGEQNVVRAVSFWTSIFGLARLLRFELLDPFFDRGSLDLQSLMIEEAVAGVLRASG